MERPLQSSIQSSRPIHSQSSDLTLPGAIPPFGSRPNYLMNETRYLYPPPTGFHIVALLRPVSPPASIHFSSFSPMIRGWFPIAVASSFPPATARQIVT